MKILEYRYFSILDEVDPIYNDGLAWSRIYEYHKVKQLILNLVGPTAKVHNTSWGFAGVHRVFRTELEKTFSYVLSSDHYDHGTTDTFIHDVTIPPAQWLIEAFDVVVNISAIEEIPFDPISIIENLYAQVKPQGYLILTFDIPGVDLQKLNSFLGHIIADVPVRLNGYNSKLQNQTYGYLNCGLLVIQKD